MINNNQLMKIALPYSEALFLSSQSVNMIEKTSNDLQIIGSTISQSNALRRFLLHPLVVPESKKRVLKDLFINQISPHVFRFLCLLVEKRRLNLLEAINEDYSKRLYQFNSTTVVHVYAAMIINDMQKQALEKKLQIITKSKKVKLLIYVRPELIGGIIIKIGSKVIDMSISGQLNQIASYLNVAYI